MKEVNYWQQFMNTGSINDYLNYRSNIRNRDMIYEAFGENHGDTVRDLGVNSYAGACSSNRNNIKDGACR